MILRSYTDLIRWSTFDERFEYLKLGGGVGQETFGFDRHINQMFYHSIEWKSVRNHVIIRDNGADLGVLGYEINAQILIHHINPMVVEDIQHGEEWITDPEFLICTTRVTHNAIHFGDTKSLISPLRPRTPGDTQLW